MATSGLPYIKPHVWEFERTIRLYLDDHEDSRSFISANLIDSIDPSLVQQDSQGQYAVLTLFFPTQNGEENSITVYFDVILTDAHEFVLGNDVLTNYPYDNERLFLEDGEVKIYIRG